MGEEGAAAVSGWQQDPYRMPPSEDMLEGLAMIVVGAVMILLALSFGS